MLLIPQVIIRYVYDKSFALDAACRRTRAAEPKGIQSAAANGKLAGRASGAASVGWDALGAGVPGSGFSLELYFLPQSFAMTFFPHLIPGVSIKWYVNKETAVTIRRVKIVHKIKLRSVE